MVLTRSLPVFLTEVSAVSLSQGISVFRSISSHEIKIIGSTTTILSKDYKNHSQMLQNLTNMSWLKILIRIQSTSELAKRFWQYEIPTFSASIQVQPICLNWFHTHPYLHFIIVLLPTKRAKSNVVHNWSRGQLDRK